MPKIKCGMFSIVSALSDQAHIFSFEYQTGRGPTSSTMILTVVLQVHTTLFFEAPSELLLPT